MVHCQTLMTLMNSLKSWLSVYIVVTLYLFVALLVLTVPV
jgi:hypothetical protein